ncbi:MAG: VapC toxin family PIN domain ribonuclease [Chloroflexia bacterium]|jgi:toxin-antitoxin system PIN domain toxin|nr:VapC toxin family PIN domain ribonuclease [Chloroflexia bacterium]
MTYLLDVNILIALLDGNHLHHVRAMRWFLANARLDWLTCPTSQNGAVRIMSGSHYGPTSFTPSSVAERLQSLMDETVHRFVADDVSLLDTARIDGYGLKASSQVTDTYLLALAVAKDAVLATMDHRLVTSAVRSGADHLLQIP